MMLVCGLKRCLSKSAECLFADVWRIGIKLLPLWAIIRVGLVVKQLAPLSDVGRLAWRNNL